MRRVAVIYTADALVAPLRTLFAEIIPSCDVVNIVDDSLIRDVIGKGRVTGDVTRRLHHYYEAAADTGAEVVLNTCSSIGDIAEAAKSFSRIPLVKIDDAMAEDAVRRGSVIGVLATLPTTLAPTVALVRRKAAEAGKSVTIIEGLATGAYEALVGGKPEMHDEMIERTARNISEKCDVIVLAQGSMARMENRLREITGKTVLSSPRLGVLAVKKLLDKGRVA